MGASGGQIFASRNARENLPFSAAAHEKQHVPGRGQDRKGQGHTGNERLLGHADGPTRRLVEFRIPGKQRGGVAVAAEPQEDNVK